MRILTMVLVSAAAMLVPALASADPAQAQAGPAPTAQTAPAQSETAQAPAAQTPQVTASASSGHSPDEIVCRMSPPATGSRLGGARECHTQREWDNRMREAQAMVTTSQGHGLGGSKNK